MVSHQSHVVMPADYFHLTNKSNWESDESAKVADAMSNTHIVETSNPISKVTFSSPASNASTNHTAGTPDASGISNADK